MNTYNKNVSALIIMFCAITVIIGIFLPKGNQHVRSKELKFEKSSHLSFNSVFPSATFNKGEKISVLKLDGPISDSSGSSFLRDITSSNSVLDLLTKATRDSNVKGIVIRINSPGGTVAASQELYRAVIKAKKKKPVVITMGDVAASGGYYIASAADVIFANPGTLTGSIGVITSYLNFYDLLNKIGVKGITIKSGEFKDIGNPTRPSTEQEKKILQSLLDDTYDQFITDVAKGRNIPKEKIRQIAKGLIYSGRQAKKIGLVDHLGDYSTALNYTQSLVKQRFPKLSRKYGQKDIPIEETWKGTSLFDVLLGSINKSPVPNAFENKLIKSFSYSRFQPLWLLE